MIEKFVDVDSAERLVDVDGVDDGGHDGIRDRGEGLRQNPADESRPRWLSSAHRRARRRPPTLRASLSPDRDTRRIANDRTTERLASVTSAAGTTRPAAAGAPAR